MFLTWCGLWTILYTCNLAMVTLQRSHDSLWRHFQCKLPRVIMFALSCHSTIISIAMYSFLCTRDLIQLVYLCTRTPHALMHLVCSWIHILLCSHEYQYKYYIYHTCIHTYIQCRACACLHAMLHIHLHLLIWEFEFLVKRCYVDLWSILHINNTNIILHSHIDFFWIKWCLVIMVYICTLLFSFFVTFVYI